MANVVLINPPFTKEEMFVRGAIETYPILPSLGIAYVAAYLERGGHKVEIIDGIAEESGVADVAKAAKSADVVGITVLSTFARRALDTAKAIKDLDSDLPIVMGGAHATAVPEEVMKERVADYLVLGEGEVTSVELVDAIENGGALGDVKGIAYLEKAGNSAKEPSVKITKPRELIEDIDDVPLPARHLLPMKKYRASEARAKNEVSHSLITSRGCPFNCTFCTKTIFGRKYRAHSPEYVLDEIGVLVEKYGAKGVDFWDDTFLVDKKRVVEICRGIKERGWDISWSCEATVGGVTPELLGKMKKSGCWLVAFGIESGSERVLKSIRKAFTKDQVRQGVKWTREAGISPRGYFILGLVGEKVEDMRQTIGFAKELSLDMATFTLMTPLPGTDDYVRAQQEGTFDKDYWKKKNITEINFAEEPPYVPEGVSEKELMRMHRKAYHDFYLRPSYIGRQVLSIRGLDDLRRMYHGAKAVLKA